MSVTKKLLFVGVLVVIVTFFIFIILSSSYSTDSNDSSAIYNVSSKISSFKEVVNNINSELDYESEFQEVSLYYNGSQFSEYPHACQVWQRLRSEGYSEYVSAGILGNMMAECGGQTLNLDYDIYGGSGGYYGLCQWSLKYTPQVRGLDVDGQLDVLLSNIETNMAYFGGDHQYFLSITDPAEAARYFQMYYERGEGGTARANNSRIAYDYFCTVGG